MGQRRSCHVRGGWRAERATDGTRLNRTCARRFWPRASLAASFARGDVSLARGTAGTCARRALSQVSGDAATASRSKAERADAVAPSINAAIKAYDDGKVSEGVSAFQARLLKAIQEANLSTTKYVESRKAGVHPDNRDEAGLVPVDVHELLDILIQNGWDYQECSKALACEIHSARATPTTTTTTTTTTATATAVASTSSHLVMARAGRRAYARKPARAGGGSQRATPLAFGSSTPIWRRGPTGCCRL